MIPSPGEIKDFQSSIKTNPASLAVRGWFILLSPISTESELFDQPGDRIDGQYGGADPVPDHGLQSPDDIYLYADYILKVVDSL